MDDVKKETEQISNSGEETVVETVARKVGSAVGAITSKVSGLQAGNETSPQRKKSPSSVQESKPSANAYEQRRRQIKKKKKTAHRHKLKGSHTKG